VKIIKGYCRPISATADESVCSSVGGSRDGELISRGGEIRVWSI
jgi:hypothetical protein